MHNGWQALLYAEFRPDLINDNKLYQMALQFFGAYHLPVKKVFRSLRLPSSTTPTGTFLIGLSFSAITMGRVVPMLFAVLAVAAVSGSVIYGTDRPAAGDNTGISCDIFLFPCFELVFKLKLRGMEQV